MKFDHDAASLAWLGSVIGSLFGVLCAIAFFALTGLTGDIAAVVATLITAAAAGSAMAAALSAGYATPKQSTPPIRESDPCSS